MALLAGGLTAAPRLVVRADHQRVFARLQGGGDFKGEGGVAPLMHACALTVHPGLTLVIHRAKVQKHPLANGFRGEGKGAPVPYRVHKIRVTDAGQRAFHAKGHQNFAA